MPSHNFLTYSGKIILQILGEILYFPLWWYTVGFGRLVKGAWRFLRNQEINLGFSVWLKNIFVPMYGQRDIAARLISFMVRTVQVIARGIALIFWLVVVLLILVFWLIFPLALLLALSFQLVK